MVPHDITVSTNAREVYVDGLSSPSESILYKFQLLDGESNHLYRSALSINALLDFSDPASTKSSGTHAGLTVMFVTPVLLFVILILYRVIRIHKICRKSVCHENGVWLLFQIDRLDRAYASANSNLFFGEWFNQQRGFRRLNEDAEEDLSDEQAIWLFLQMAKSWYFRLCSCLHQILHSNKTWRMVFYIAIGIFCYRAKRHVFPTVSEQPENLRCMLLFSIFFFISSVQP